jgi:hypothetical protein
LKRHLECRHLTLLVRVKRGQFFFQDLNAHGGILPLSFAESTSTSNASVKEGRAGSPLPAARR